MREEKEIRWIINLITSKEFANTLFKRKGGSLCDFETCANNSSRDKEFNKWFKYLVEIKIITFLESKENSKGSPTKIYLLDKSKLFKYLKEFSFYKKMEEIVIDNL
jgi:hypothetical protein